MSTVILKKDHGDKKKGETISVPFITGRKLVADGVGEYPPQPKVAAPATADSAVDKAKADAAAAKRAADSLTTELTDLTETHRVALAELADARKQVAALTAERDELAKKSAKAK